MKSLNSRHASGMNSHNTRRNKFGRHRRRLGVFIVALSIILCFLALLLFSNFTQASAQGPESNAADLIQRAWAQARDAGGYAFDADITQIRRPLASTTNVGRQAERERLYLEGLTELDAQRLEMTLWMNGGAVLDKNTGAQIRIEGDAAYARQGDQPWEEINNFTGLFAPENDFMAYLVAAVNVENQGAETRAGIDFTRLTFDIDGPAYARHMRDQVQAEMARRGELPAGMQLGIPDMYNGMTGSGELWIGEDELPLRQILQLEFAPEGDEQVSAAVKVNFKDFNPAGVTANVDDSAVVAALNKVAPIIPGTATAEEIIAATKEMAGNGSSLLPALIMLGIFIGALYYARRSRKVMAALQITLIISMLFAPLLRSVHASQFSDLLEAHQEAADARAQNSNLADALQSLEEGGAAAAPGTVEDILNDPGIDGDGDGYTDVQELFLGTSPAWASKGTAHSLRPPHALPLLDVPVEPLPANNGDDTDGDGLTDYVEALLGTLPEVADTDNDGITDTLEVEGFDYNGVTWVTDPLEMDTNRDGISDGQEWFVNAVNGVPADSDGDLTPDLFDEDNDGDGVPDDLDLSPYTSIAYTFAAHSPFSLVLDGLTPDKLTYVEFQLRPTDADHLQYAFDVFDWPDDQQGNIQDGNGSQDDVRLLPMLELLVPDASAHLLPLDVLRQYHIMVQDLPDSNHALYVPLVLVTENKGARNVAFNGKMIYNGAAHWGDAHQVRLVWIVQANNDVCGEFDDTGLCSNYEEFDRPQVIHTYDDTWKLTGLNVRENHWVDVATVYEDPTPGVDADVHDDTALWQLSHGLDHSFMAGGTVTGTTGTRLWDIAEIARRFDHNTNAGVDIELRWNISNTLSVATASYSHLDEALMTTVQTTTLNLLTTHFSPQWSASNPISPTLLFARQDKYRSYNLDQVFDPGHNPAGWQNNQLSLNIPESAVPLEIASTLSWAPYLYDENAAAWQSYPIELYWDYLAANMEADMLAAFSDPEAAGGATLLAQIYYVALMNGVSNIVQIGEQRLEQSFYNQDRPIGAGIAKSSKVGVVFLVKSLIEKQNIEQTELLKQIFMEVRDASKNPVANPLGTTKLLVSGLYNRFMALGTAGRGLAGSAAILIAVGLLVGISFLIEKAFNEGTAGPARIAAATLVGAVTAYANVIAPLAQIRTLSSLYQSPGYGALSASAALNKAVYSAKSVSLGAKVAAGVGMVIAIGISWGVFIYAVTSSNISPGSVAFNTLLAQAIAATIIAVIQFALSFTLIGAIIVAILGIIDLLLFVLGVNFTINGWMTEQLGKFLYHFELTIDQDIDTVGPDLSLVDPDLGMIDGAMMAAAMAVTSTITHNDPNDFWGWRVLPYLPAYYTRNNLKSTTFEYTLTTAESPFNVGRNDMPGKWRQIHVDHEYAAWDMYQATNFVQPTINIELEVGLNGALSLYLNNSYALPGVECWTIYQPFVFPYYIPICIDKTIDGNGSSDLGSYLILDVLPATLDQFVALDWGGNVPFPPQLDNDNDGLVARAMNGNDPDDFDWDSDDDLLSDAYEIDMRANGTLLKPGNPDSDFDGLSDYDELRFGTDPGFPDTDRDGLTDSEEVWHFDTRTLSWQGGWDFTAIFTDTNQSPNQALTVRIFSDPLLSDADNDGLSDGVEKALHEQDPIAYPFHPNAFNENPVALYLAFDDQDGFVGPNQTLTISATANNNLSAPLFALGDLALTLPAELGGSVLTQNFNIFQAQASSIVTDVTVMAPGSSGPISVAADYFAHLHNGNLSWSYNWLPRVPDDTDWLFPEFGTPFLDYAYNARLATNPGPVSYEYALAVIESPQTHVYPEVRVFGDGAAMARPADTVIGEPEVINRVIADTYHPNGKVGNYEPAIACNAQGNCAEAYVDVVWQSCADVYFDYVHVHGEDDAGDHGEFYLKHEGAKFWGTTPGEPGEDFAINETRRVCAGDEIKAYEADPSPNADDYLGKHEPDMSGPHTTSHNFSSGGNKIELFYTVEPNPNHYGFLRLLDSDLKPDGSVQNNAIPMEDLNGFVAPLANPAVATSGSRWMAGFETGEAPSALYTMNVNNSGLDYFSDQLDKDDLDNSFHDHNLDLVWADNLDLPFADSGFLAVWERDQWNYSIIRMAISTENGFFAYTRPVEINGNPRLPSIAYNPSLGRALIAYVDDTKVVGRFFEGGHARTVGPRFDIGFMPDEEDIEEVNVAYDENNNLWIVSWLGVDTNNFPTRRQIHYVALAPGTLNGGATAVTPVKTLPPSPSGWRFSTHSLACGHPDVPLDPDFRITSNCAIVRSSSATGEGGPITLDTILLESTPPWLDGGGGLTDSATEVLIVDTDVPTATLTSFTPGETINITDTFVFGGDAGDPTSNIALVEVNIDGAGWQPAIGTASWSYAWPVPATDGAHTIQLRATDVVGNVGTESPITIHLDRSAPTPGVSGSPDQFVQATQDAAGRWHVTFSGTAGDTQSTVSAVEATISPMGSGWQTATLDTGGNWTLDYVLPEFDENSARVVNPTGDFTLIVRARDVLGNVTIEGGYTTLSFKLDTTPPEATLTGFGPSRGIISDTLTLSGVITDPGAVSSGLQQLEIEFVPIVSETINGWTPVALAASGPGVTHTTWTHPVPDLEGNYLINLRGTDVQGNQGAESSWLSGWQGEIDTLAPRAQIEVYLRGNGKTVKTHIEATIYDRNLTEAGLEFPCPVQRKDRGYETDTVLNNLGSGQEQLTSLNLDCQINGIITDPVTLRVFDLYGHVTEQTVPPPTLNSPTVASTVLTPTHESVISDLSSPIDVTIGAYAVNGLKALTMTINSALHYTTTWAAGPLVTDTLTSTTWTPPGEGVYLLETVVEDWAGAVQTEMQPVTVTVDTTPPNLTLDSDVLTETHRLSTGRFELSGTASDTVGLEAVTVSVDGGNPVAAELDDPAWRSALALLTDPDPALATDPDGVTHTVVIEASDAGNSTTINTTIVVDLVGPQIMTVTTGYSAGGTPIPVAAGETVTNATGLTLAWNDATDGSAVAGYRAGWTNSPTPTLSALTFYPDASAIHTTPVGEASKWYGHLAALDAVSNVAIETFGPIYVDAPTTPDYINPADPLEGVYRGWMQSGCSLVGADYEVARYASDGAAQNTVQNFYLTWDATHLRMAWTGADWRVDGDLFIYLDTASGGATEAYNPYGGAGATIALPDEGGGQMAADYLIFVEDGDTAGLFRWDGSGWIADQTLTAPNFLFDPNGAIETTDLTIPFSLLGSPTNMNLVALASEEEALRLWAAMPDHNPLNSARAVNPVAAITLDLPFALTNHYAWMNAGGSGECPADGQFENGALRLQLTAEPAGVSVGFLQHDLPGLTLPAAALDADLDGTLDVALPLDVDPAPVGLGQAVSYVLHYANHGTADVTAVVANLTAAGGLANLSDTSIALGTIPAGATGAYTITADIDPNLDGESAELKIEIADATHVPFDWLWVQHDIDSVGPTGVEIELPVAYIGPDETILEGVVTDVSAVPEITLRIDGSTTQTCPDPTPRDGRWSCLFDAGGAADGTPFQFDALGTDEWGNAGANFGPAVTLIVDSSAPTISLNAATLANLADNLLIGGETLLQGLVTDDRSAEGAEICALAAGETEPECVRVPVSSRGQLTSNWSAFAPIPGDADGDDYTLSIYGIDSAGNRSATPLVYNITADLIGPEVDITTHRKIIVQYSSVDALAGTIADGTGVASFTLQVTLPDNGDNNLQDEYATVPLGSGPNWNYALTPVREGNYQFGLVAVDTHGNETTLGTFTSRVIEGTVNVPPTADTGGPYDVGEGAAVTLSGSMDDINIVSGQTITPSWDLDDDGTFETTEILDPVFDATNIDGTDQRIIWLQVTDGEFTTTVSTTVTILNLNPTADAGGPYAVSEGAQLTVSGDGTDPFPGDTLTYTWDLDDDAVFGDAFGTTAIFDATNLNGPISATVSLQVTDDDGGFNIATAAISVTNAPPELANLAYIPIPVPENNVATLSGDIVSASALEALELEIVWGDGRGSTVAISPTTAVAAGIPLIPGSAAGNQVLRLNGEVLSEAGFQHRFASGNTWVSQDWSNYDGVSFWYYGVGNGTGVFVEVFDNRNPGSTIDDAERWRYEFTDNTAGWQQISLLFTDFERVEDEAGAPNDGLGLTEVWGWALGTAATNGIETRFIDDFSLTSGTNTTTVDDFESGLPTGMDSNGIVVGFSTRIAGWDGTNYFSYPAGSTFFTATHLYIDDDDDDSYTVDLLISDDDGGTNSYTTTITIYNVAPVVTFTPATQNVQYSDVIAPIMITATDVVSDPLGISTYYQVEGGFPLGSMVPGLSLAATGCGNNNDYTQTCNWTVTGIADVPAGNYELYAQVSDGDGGFTLIDIPIIVAAEQTSLKFDGDNPVAVQVDAPGSNASEPFSLVVNVEELEPDLAAYLAAPGNINLANVSIVLEPVGPGGTAVGNCNSVLTGSGDSYDDFLTTTCEFDDVPVNTYTIALIVDGGYYTGYAEDVIVIYDPSLGFTTGGGWFYWPGTEDPDTGYPGDKTNFGYTMQYNPPMTNIQGNLLLIRHLPDGTIYRLKSNAIEGLALGDTGFFGWASFAGKGTYLEPGWPEPIGNHTFLFYVEDHNEPGNGIDRVWVEVRDKDEIVIPVMSLDWPGSANAVEIDGGNLVVPHSGGTGNNPPTAGFSYMVNGLTVNFTDESSDPGGSIVAWAWDFGDGNTSTAQHPTHAYATDGTYDVLLTVTDDEGAQDSTAQQVTVSAAGGSGEMYIGDLQGSTTPGNGNKWNAHVTILVLDELGNPVADAQVTGSWSNGASGTSTCQTNSSGLCTLTKSNINGNQNSVTFTVDDVTHASLTYNPALNVFTSIVVTKPI